MRVDIYSYQGFNPRARAGRDENIRLERRIVDLVSIHAPARGATEAPCVIDLRSKFQSTRPRGARRGQTYDWQRGRCSFNPRARAGRDLGDGRDLQRRHAVSIHAPARGATHTYIASSQPGSFNPRARAGRDRTPHYL